MSHLDGKIIGITGAGGFIGSRILEVLKSNYHPKELRGLDNSPLAKSVIEQNGAVAIIGDVNDKSAVEKFCQGANIIIHCAAIVRDDGDFKLFRKVNVEGTRNVASTAQKCGVSQFVHLSSVMVYGFQYPDDISEEGPFRGENNPYCTTKIESEQAVLAYNNTTTKESPNKMSVLIVRPGDVYGCGPSPWVLQPILAVETMGSMLLVNSSKGVINHVYVDNLIDGIFLLLEKGKSGEAYNITDGQKTTWESFYSQYFGKVYGARKHISTPETVHMVIMGFLLFLFAFLRVFNIRFGEGINVSTSAAKYLGRPHAVSVDKIRKLGYKPKVDLEEGLTRVSEWVKASVLNRS